MTIHDFGETNDNGVWVPLKTSFDEYLMELMDFI